MLFERRELARVTQAHHLIRQSRHDQARVGRHGQQHLAHRFGLLGVQALGGRPVCRQAQASQACEIARQAQRCRAQTRVGRGGFARQAAQTHPVQRTGHREVRVLRQRHNRLGGLDRAGKRAALGTEIEQCRARSVELRADLRQCVGRGFHAVRAVCSGYH